jgi:hypothetical protein
MRIEDNEVLATLELNALTYVYDLYIRNNEALTELSLPALTLADDEFYIEDNDALVSFEAPFLESAYDLEIYSNPALTTLVLPSLRSVEGWAGDNASLSECALTEVNFRIDALYGNGHFYDDGGNKSDTCGAETYCPFVNVGGVVDRYRVCEDGASFGEAQTACQGFGGDLVVFDNTDETKSFMNAIADEKLMSELWVGYSDADTEGTWAWVTGVTGDTAPVWSGSEPDDGGGSGENCAVLSDDNGLLSDRTCEDSYSFICEIPAAAP